MNVDDPTTATTFPRLIRGAAAAYGDEAAIVLRSPTMPEESLSFIDLDRETAALARGLIARGAGKGARIGFIAGNGPFFAVALGAIARIGAIAVPISTMIRSDELVRTLRQSDVAGIVVQRRFLNTDYVQRLCEALPELRDGGPELRIATTPYLRWIVTTGGDLPASFGTMDDLIEEGRGIGDDLLLAIESEIHPTDQMVEIYTSGSMALPKGVRHNHGPVMARTHYLRGMIGPTRGQEVDAFLPMFWVGGMMMCLLPDWSAGATTICAEKTLSNSQVAMGSVIAAEDLKLMAAARPYWGLGMSETLGPYSYGDELRAPGFPVCAPMDHFAEGFEVRVADAHDQPVPEGTVGEIQVRGPALSPGLHKVERAGTYTADGYYHTGDLGVFAGARLNFVGRNGDIIKTAGSNVSPLEVEDELQRLEGVHSAYVAGIPDRERGQLVVAAIVPREGAALDFSVIEATLRTRLSSYKVPRAWLAIDRAEVPLLHSNKVSRKAFQTMMIEKLGR